MKKIFINNPFFRILVPPVYGILVYLLIILINNEVSQVSEIFMGQEVYVCIGLSFLLSEVLRINVIVNDKFFPLGFNAINRILLQLVTGIFLSIIVITLSISSYFEYILSFSITETQLIIFNSIFFISSLLYNLLYFSNLYMYKQNIDKLENEKILTESVEAELAQFKNEINPLLFYDALETLITLIHKNTEESEDYIDHLSGIYRYILSHRKVELASIKEEIKAAEHIVYLLNYKHENHIKFIAVVDNEYTDMPMVPNTLPNLIEHIIRSTIINKYNPLTVKLYLEKRDNYMVVESKLNDRLIENEYTSHVFKNIQKSYGFYSESPVIKVKANDYNYFKIPLMEVKEEMA